MFLYRQLWCQAEQLYDTRRAIIEKNIGFPCALKIPYMDVQRRSPGADGCYGISQAYIARRRIQWCGGVHYIIASMRHDMDRID